MYISADHIIKIAAVLSALGVIGGILIWLVMFWLKQKKQGKAIEAICEEQTVLCFGIYACLKGLKEQGCNGPVTEALEKFSNHLNNRAHKWDEL